VDSSDGPWQETFAALPSDVRKGSALPKGFSFSGATPFKLGAQPQIIKPDYTEGRSPSAHQTAKPWRRNADHATLRHEDGTVSFFAPGEVTFIARCVDYCFGSILFGL
jgi:hypothetical protein